MRKIRKISLVKYDMLLWSVHYLNGKSQLDPAVFRKGLMMILPSGNSLGFTPIPNMKVPVLKPVKSDGITPGYKEWTGLEKGATIMVSVAVGFKEPKKVGTSR